MTARYQGLATIESPPVTVAVSVELWSLSAQDGAPGSAWGGVFSSLDRDGVRELGALKRVDPDHSFTIRLRETGDCCGIRLIRTGVGGCSGELLGTTSQPPWDGI